MYSGDSTAYSVELIHSVEDTRINIRTRERKVKQVRKSTSLLVEFFELYLTSPKYTKLVPVTICYWITITCDIFSNYAVAKLFRFCKNLDA